MAFSHFLTKEEVYKSLDMYYLEYFEDNIHFAGHYVAMYGYDEEFGYLVDGNAQVKSSLGSIAEARNYKGPMSSPNRAFTIYPDMGLHEAYLKFAKIAPMWRGVSQLICSAGENSDVQQLKEASQILLDISSLEEEAMKLLFNNTFCFVK